MPEIFDLGQIKEILKHVNPIEVVEEGFVAYSRGKAVVPPRAGGMAFLRYNLKINSRKLATELREKKSVFIMDGDCFGMDHYLRIGIGSEKEYFLAGLDVVSEMLQEVKV